MSLNRKIGRPVPLPKFGDWDVNNPASADGFTVIFGKARDERKGSSTTSHDTTNRPANNTDGKESRTTSANTESKQDSRRTEKMSSYDSTSRSSSNSAFSKKGSYNSRTAASKKWFCCASPSPTQS